MSRNVFSPDAWTRARNRFVEDLSEEEKKTFFQASAESILYDASATDKIHEGESTSRKVLAKVQPFIEAVQQYGHALDVYSSTYPLVMGPLWGSIRVVLQLARESGKYFEKLADMFNRISDVLPRLKVYERLFPDHERLIRAMSAVYFDVLQFCTDAKKVFRRAKRSITALIWKPFEHQFGSRMEQFREHMNITEKEVTTSHMIEAADSRALVRANHAQLAKERYDEQKLQVFASLSEIDHEDKHGKLQRLRFMETGTWLLQHPNYRAWKQSVASSGLCCHGIPGSGKSVLTSLIVDDHLHSRSSQEGKMVYHYCDYADPVTLQPVHIYRALLRQLFLKGLMDETVVGKIVEKLRYNVKGLNEQGFSNLLIDTIKSCGGLHIILDGLDECPREVQQTLVSLLQHLMTNRHVNVKVFMTCRDEGHLLRDLSQFNRLHVSARASANDIESYISNAVESKISAGQLTLRNETLKIDIIAKLKAKAQGMFLWVHFQINDLCEATSDHEIRQVLDHLPEGLHGTYSRIFGRIYKDKHSPYTMKMMKWIACARRPLRIEELQEAVAFDSTDRSWDPDRIPDADKIIRSCLGVVVRDVEDAKVQFAHHTVQQFLLSSGLTPEEEWDNGSYNYIFAQQQAARTQFTIEHAEELAGEVCAAYLCFSDFESAVAVIEDKKSPDLLGVFRGRGPISIPTALGLGTPLHSLPYQFLGSENDIKMPKIDYSKYLNPRAKKQQPVPTWSKKYALLEYVIEHWQWHTRWFWSPETSSRALNLNSRFWNLVQHKSLSFEFRPWGPNQHFGPYGCKGCPIPAPGVLQGKDLSLMGLIHWAAETGHVSLLSSLPRHILGQHLVHESYHNQTFLIACRHGQDAIIQVLRKASILCAEPNESAVVAACASGSVSTVAGLLDYYDNNSYGHRRPPSIEIFGQRALYQTLTDGHEQLAEMLVERGAKTAYRDPILGMTSLHVAAMRGNTALFNTIIRTFDTQGQKLLEERQESEDRTKSTGNTALHYAATNGHDEIVALILRLRFDPNDCPNEGLTPLILAAQNGHASVVKTLLDNGANADVRAGENVLMPDQRTTYHILNSFKPAAIQYAASEGHANVLGLLPYTNMTCGTLAANALHFAAAYGHHGAVSVLLSKGLKPDAKDNRGLAALHYASMYSHEEVARILIAHGASINQTDAENYAALHRAIEKGHIGVAKLLLSHGAATMTHFFLARNEVSALHVAVRHANPDMIKLLVSESTQEKRTEEVPLEIALEHAILCGRSVNVLALIKLGASWRRSKVFVTAAWHRNTRILFLLLNRLVYEPRDCSDFDFDIMRWALSTAEKRKNYVAVRYLKRWLGQGGETWPAINLPDEAWEDGADLSLWLEGTAW